MMCKLCQGDEYVRSCCEEKVGLVMLFNAVSDSEGCCVQEMRGWDETLLGMLFEVVVVEMKMVLKG